MITLLNTSIITAYGSFLYQPLPLDGAIELVQPIPCINCIGNGCPLCDGRGQIQGFDSAIGHQSTAEILSELLGVSVPVNRQNYIQPPNSNAVVFKLKERAPEGAILSRPQIEKIGYEFGLLTRFE